MSRISIMVIFGDTPSAAADKADVSGASPERRNRRSFTRRVMTPSGPCPDNPLSGSGMKYLDTRRRSAIGRCNNASGVTLGGQRRFAQFRVQHGTAAGTNNLFQSVASDCVARDPRSRDAALLAKLFELPVGRRANQSRNFARCIMHNVAPLMLQCNMRGHEDCDR